MTYTFIACRCGDLPVAACCRVMGVSTSGYYAWRVCPVSDRDWADAQLTNTIFDIHQMSRRSYGSPRAHAELVLGQGEACGRKRVERLMAQAAIVGIHRRKSHGCTRRNPDAIPSEDLVNRDFKPAKPDRLWVMDVTEHPTAEGKVYLAVVLDAFSRRVVGWSIADHMRTEICTDALQAAVATRGRARLEGVIFHSDHGCQYTSSDYKKMCADMHIVQSMGTVGGSYDNAMAESFWASLKRELVDDAHYATKDEARVAIFEWLVWYNRERLHSSIGYQPPEEYEDDLLSSQAA